MTTTLVPTVAPISDPIVQPTCVTSFIKTHSAPHIRGWEAKYEFTGYNLTAVFIGRLIGKNGKNIKPLESTYQTKYDVIRVSETCFKVNIVASTEHNTEVALEVFLRQIAKVATVAIVPPTVASYTPMTCKDELFFFNKDGYKDDYEFDFEDDYNSYKSYKSDYTRCLAEVLRLKQEIAYLESMNNQLLFVQALVDC